MLPTQHAALNLPEIIARIGSFLLRESIVACLTVSSSFHVNLVQFIYRNLHIYSNRRPPPPQTLFSYAHLVHDLSIHAFMSLTYLTAGYKNLRFISFSGFQGNASRQVGTDDEILDALLKLVQDNLGLRACRMNDPWPQFPRFIWKAIAETTTELDELTVCHTTVDEVSKPWFLRVCQKARRLEVLKVKVLGSGSSMDFSGDVDTISSASQLDKLQSSNRLFSPQKVHFDDVLGISMLEQLEFLSRCPSLQGFVWKAPKGYIITTNAAGQELFPRQADFRHFLQPTTWPCLTSVDIDCNNSTWVVNGVAHQLLTDECLGNMLDSIQAGKLEQFVCKGSELGALGMTSLMTRHFSNLSVLCGSGCGGITSPMVQRLLELCPQLTNIDVSELHVRDLRKGRPWVCTALTELYVQFNLRLEEGDLGWRDFACSPLADKIQDALETTRFIEDQQHVFRRLAGLTSLQSLDVQVLGGGFNGMVGSDGSILHFGLLDFRISHGLEMLSPLKELRYLDVSDTFQQLEREDVEMMVVQWPKFFMLRGVMNSDEQVDAALSEYLEGRSVDRGLYDDY